MKKKETGAQTVKQGGNHMFLKKKEKKQPARQKREGQEQGKKLDRQRLTFGHALVFLEVTKRARQGVRTKAREEGSSSTGKEQSQTTRLGVNGH